MKLITRDTDYAVRALCYIAKSKEKIVSVSDLVKALKIPQPFLRKILQILNKKRILKSYKGLGGGFALSQESKKIYLLNIIKAFQGKLQLNECLFKKMACPNKSTCYLKKKIRAIEQNVIRDLESITISSLSR